MTKFMGENDSLMGIANRKLYQEGDLIFFEGDEANYVYIILHGSVKIFKAASDGSGVKDICTLHEKQMFGEFAVLNDSGRNASAIAMAPTEVMVIGKEQFKKKFSKLDPFFKFWFEYLIESIQDLTERLPTV